MSKTKLPKSLTTVTTFSKIVAILIFFIFLSASFREGMMYEHKVDTIEELHQPTIATMPQPSSHEATTIMITPNDNGKEKQIKIGDKIVLQLDDTMDWNIGLSNFTTIVTDPDGINYIHATQGRYKAVKPGRVNIIGLGTKDCSNGCPSSSLARTSFFTTLVVTQ